MPLSEVLYQDEAQERLQRAFRVGRMAHAYLFAGPSGVGKEMLAARLAAVLLCAEPVEVPAPTGAIGSSPTWRDACGRCVDCRLLAAGNHPDLHRIHRILGKMHPDKEVRNRKATVLGVDVIRHFLIEKMGLRPSRDRAKVFIICEAERMNEEAQNAMLKTLEEPPEHSYIILLATSADVLLPTTRSRCQLVTFRSLPVEFVAERLEQERGLKPGDARFLAELARGSVGLALQGADAKLHQLVPGVLEAMMRAAKDPLGCGKSLLEMANELAEYYKEREQEDDEESVDTNAARSGQVAVLSVVSTILRDVLRAAAGAEPVATSDRVAVRALAGGAGAEAIGKAVKAMAAAEYQIARSANTSLIFDGVGIAVGQALSMSSARR
ncbi:MAG TPA: DNA polymerase III subunit [Phycisphaerae bacterium]|nr:DNA polymerase III subunit [Phycisphaerae bacterium]